MLGGGENEVFHLKRNTLNGDEVLDRRTFPVFTMTGASCVGVGLLACRNATGVNGRIFLSGVLVHVGLAYLFSNTTGRAG